MLSKNISMGSAATLRQQMRGISYCLPEFHPISKDPSDIIDDIMRA